MLTCMWSAFRQNYLEMKKGYFRDPLIRSTLWHILILLHILKELPYINYFNRTSAETLMFSFDKIKIGLCILNFWCPGIRNYYSMEKYNSCSNPAYLANVKSYPTGVLNTWEVIKHNESEVSSDMLLVSD